MSIINIIIVHVYWSIMIIPQPHPIIISWNSSKSRVPEPSSSTSSMMLSRSSSVRVVSISRRISWEEETMHTYSGDLSVRDRAGNETSWRFVPSSRWKLYLEHIGGDEALPLLVVDPERLLQLLLHLLLVILDQELGGNLDRWRWMYSVCIVFSSFILPVPNH